MTPSISGVALLKMHIDVYARNSTRCNYLRVSSMLGFEISDTEPLDSNTMKFYIQHMLLNY
jgi:hypothetical protein